jgi:serine/threonine protein kinase
MCDMPEKVYDLLDRLNQLITKLHEIGILHNDIYSLNVVYDVSTDRLKFIDFGLSEMITDICLEDSHWKWIINRGVQLYGEDIKHDPLKYILNLDKRNLTYIRYRKYHEWANKKDNSIDGRIKYPLKMYLEKKSTVI